MLAENIIDVVSKFTGNNNEPSGKVEIYILKSMWVMMLSEFEGRIKELVESHIDDVKKLDINDIHICLLLQHFSSDKDGGMNVKDVISVFKKNPKDISYGKFTQDYKPKYKFKPIEKLFNTLGVFFSDSEETTLKKLDSIASTRDSIAHGDSNVAITKNELVERINDLREIFTLLENKLKAHK